MLRASIPTSAHRTGRTIQNADRAKGGGLVVVCVDCGEAVFEWSTPELDRCWQCAESADAEAGQ